MHDDIKVVAAAKAVVVATMCCIGFACPKDSYDSLNKDALR